MKQERKLTELGLLLIGKHRHKFTITVEWKTRPNDRNEPDDWTRTWVTKLRCECGEELKR